MSLHLHRELVELRKQILSMATLVEDHIAKGHKALLERDHKLAREVVEADHEIDELEIKVEEECLKILALHQPVANDLRLIVSMLKMNNDLERMGDHAVNLAKRAEWLAAHDPLDWPPQINEMAQMVRTMVHQGMDALIQADAQLAQQVCANDDQVDQYKRRLIDLFKERLCKDPQSTETLLKMIDVPRQLERIADLATNICEDIIYMLQGNIIRHHHYIERKTT